MFDQLVEITVYAQGNENTGTILNTSNTGMAHDAINDQTPVNVVSNFLFSFFFSLGSVVFAWD